jgi:hypothetical protein
MMYEYESSVNGAREGHIKTNYVPLFMVRIKDEKIK